MLVVIVIAHTTIKPMTGDKAASSEHMRRSSTLSGVPPANWYIDLITDIARDDPVGAAAQGWCSLQVR